MEDHIPQRIDGSLLSMEKQEGGWAVLETLHSFIHSLIILSFYRTCSPGVSYYIVGLA